MIKPVVSQGFYWGISIPPANHPGLSHLFPIFFTVVSTVGQLNIHALTLSSHCLFPLLKLLSQQLWSLYHFYTFQICLHFLGLVSMSDCYLSPQQITTQDFVFLLLPCSSLDKTIAWRAVVTFSMPLFIVLTCFEFLPQKSSHKNS